MWRDRIAFLIKIAAIVCVLAGFATFPTSIGSVYCGLSLFHYIETLGIFLPIGAGLVMVGLVLLLIGRAISREWLF